MALLAYRETGFAHAQDDPRHYHEAVSVFKLPHGGRKHLIARWNSLLSSQKIDPDESFAILDDLLTRYSEPQRVYHNLAHIDKLLELLPPGAALEFAVWFHDAIYDPTQSDNEAQSALLAAQRLGQMGAKTKLVQEVQALILATATHQSQNPTQQWLVEADLSILGSPEKTYKSYAKAIRQEYSWLPDEVFMPNRAKVLERFMARPKIFSLERFERLEARARQNMQEELQQLKLAIGS